MIKVRAIFIKAFLTICSCSFARAEPTGILLKGSPKSPAISVLTDYIAPSKSEELEVFMQGGNEYYQRRLEAVINPKASVSDVNIALKNVGAKLSYSSSGDDAVTLTLSRSMDLDGLRKIAKKLTESGAFIVAGPSSIDGPSQHKEGSNKKSGPLSKSAAPIGPLQKLQKPSSIDDSKK